MVSRLSKWRKEIFIQVMNYMGKIQWNSTPNINTYASIRGQILITISDFPTSDLRVKVYSGKDYHYHFIRCHLYCNRNWNSCRVSVILANLLNIDLLIKKTMNNILKASLAGKGKSNCQFDLQELHTSWSGIESHFMLQTPVNKIDKHTPKKKMNKSQTI